MSSVVNFHLINLEKDINSKLNIINKLIDKIPEDRRCVSNQQYQSLMLWKIFIENHVIPSLISMDRITEMVYKL